MGDILVFVDDDNILEKNYLENALIICSEFPWVGAFNGSTLGEYEYPLPGWAEFSLPYLAVWKIYMGGVLA